MKSLGQENILKKSIEPKKATYIKGYDFNQGVDYAKIVDSYSTTGFQAVEFAKAVDIINQMRKEGCLIYLGYTSNMVSSGLRDVFRYLVQHKMVDVVVTTAGGIEEDFIKCLGPFILGDWNLDGARLREDGINRIGNILVPNERYINFEKWITPIFEKLTQEQKASGEIITPSKFIHRLGKEINNEESIYYWAQKNEIPVFCPALLDGSIGDMLFFFKWKKKALQIEVSDDAKLLNDMTLRAKKTGIIVLGGGVMKHTILNTNLLRNGANYSVYINTAPEFDGSDSGANPSEAVSWGKLLPEAKSVKLFADATIVFPLIVAKTFAAK